MDVRSAMQKTEKAFQEYHQKALSLFAEQDERPLVLEETSNKEKK